MNWDAYLKEATEHLQHYIRIDTVNPPGNEIEGAKFFENLFNRESISCEVYEPEKGRGNVLALLKGDGSKRPILLCSHMDVVPVEREKWEVDPFSGTIRDGYLYGRGTLDDKTMGILEMMTLFIAKREGLRLKRDLLFLATADEETGGRWGIRWAVQNLPVLDDVEYALNEGGDVILDEKGSPTRYEISNGQKVICHLKLKARGTSGHGSMPHRDNPNVKLVQALDRVTKWETPFKILPSVKEYFRKLAPRQSPREMPFYEDIEEGLKDPSFLARFTSNPIYNAMIRDTIALTTLQGGNKTNVIPSESSATLDCRLIPGYPKEDFLNELRRHLGNEIEWEVLSESRSIPPSPLDTDLFRAIERFAQERDPGCPVLPHLLPGATDSRYLREKGIITYDFCFSRLTEEELLRVHGNNERISLENLRFGMEMMFSIVREVAT